MNYSTLTIPTPECCDECPCMGGITLSCVVCRTTGIIIKNPLRRAENCPLKPAEEIAFVRESGVLMRLPCKIGDTVYRIDTESETIIKDTIMQITICDGFVLLHGHVIDEMDTAEVGKTVFFDKEEARRRLEEMRNDL